MDKPRTHSSSRVDFRAVRWRQKAKSVNGLIMKKGTEKTVHLSSCLSLDKRRGKVIKNTGKRCIGNLRPI